MEKGFFESRNRAQSAIMAGKVMVDGRVVDKPGTRFADNVDIQLLEKDIPYVSRGGLKLEKAIEVFGISFYSKTVLDIGASTGGFTDCALKHGAEKVFAVDVGYGQLDWKLRKDPRVINMERTNARYLTVQDVGERVHIATIDVSFISLLKILPAVYDILENGGEVVALIKPQFEAGREYVGKKGVVKNPEVHKMVILRILEGAEKLGFSVKGIWYSPIKGPEGNIEYLLYLIKEGGKSVSIDVNGIVERAWREL
ncbi:MAG: Hemolysin A [Clostridia bacterium 41_269]|nr:MAG: Hemolysin A [Clostridia bacterium 41_269]